MEKPGFKVKILAHKDYIDDPEDSRVGSWNERIHFIPLCLTINRDTVK